MNHMILGAALPFLAGVVVYAIRRRHATFRMLVLYPLAMALGMLWAVAPDIPRLFGNETLYMKLYRDPRCNIFLWHYSIDQVENDSATWEWICFAMIFALLLFPAWRELNVSEKESDR